MFIVLFIYLSVYLELVVVYYWLTIAEGSAFTKLVPEKKNVIEENLVIGYRWTAAGVEWYDMIDRQISQSVTGDKNVFNLRITWSERIFKKF